MIFIQLKGGHTVYQSRACDSSRIDEILDVIARLYIQPVILRIIKVDENDFPPFLRPPCITFSFQSTPLLRTDSWHVWRDTSRLMIFLFLSNTRPLFPLILLLSLSLSLYIYTSFHIFSQIVGSLWLETDRIDCLMASFPYVRRFIVKLLALPLSGDPTISFKIYFYTPRFEKRIQSPDDSDG